MTTSTPPAWHFLHECDAPVTMEELSIHSRKLPVADTLREQNDSDQCSECRCAPGQLHAPGCDEAAKVTDAQSNAGPEHVKSCASEGSREHPAWVCFDCGTDRYGRLNTIVSTWHMGRCDICGETEACTEPRDFGNRHDGGPLVTVESCPECGTVADIEYGNLNQVTEDGLSNPLHAHMWETFNQCLSISRHKNADYATDSDPLANFRACQQFGVPLTKGIMVRLSDKFARIGNLLDREAQVKDEAIADSIDDAIDYLAILKYALETE